MLSPENNGQGRYDAFEALNAARQDKAVRNIGKQRSGKAEEIVYHQVLENIQNSISNSEEYNRVLSKALESENDTGKQQLSSIVYELLQRYKTPIPEAVVQEYRKRIVEDMTGFGIITDYVYDDITEEINVFGPGPRRIEIVQGKKKFWLEEGFYSAQEIVDIGKRLVRVGNVTMDQSNPIVDSFLGKGTRASAMMMPVIREEDGAVLSIRKQTKSKISRQELIDGGTALPEEFELLELLIRNKVSGAVVGATGSGKTTLLNYMLTDYAQAEGDDARIYVIEESRELQLPPESKTIYTAVTPNISAIDLLIKALRFHPTLITPAEMRGGEAMSSMMSSQTGHIVWSTFHAENCEGAFYRLQTMCKLSGIELSERLLLRDLVDAFPVIVSTKQLRDGKRKITGIYEATGLDGENVIGHYIYKFQVTKFHYDEHGKVTKIDGRHQRVGYLSDHLAQKVFDNCGLYEQVKKFTRPDWKPEGFEYMDLTGSTAPAETPPAQSASTAPPQPTATQPTQQAGGQYRATTQPQVPVPPTQTGAQQRPTQPQAPAQPAQPGGSQPRAPQQPAASQPQRGIRPGTQPPQGGHPPQQRPAQPQPGRPAQQGGGQPRAPQQPTGQPYQGAPVQPTHQRPAQPQAQAQTARPAQQGGGQPRAPQQGVGQPPQAAPTQPPQWPGQQPPKQSGNLFYGSEWQGEGTPVPMPPQAPPAQGRRQPQPAAQPAQRPMSSYSENEWQGDGAPEPREVPGAGTPFQQWPSQQPQEPGDGSAPGGWGDIRNF